MAEKFAALQRYQERAKRVVVVDVADLPIRARTLSDNPPAKRSATGRQVTSGPARG
jgi:hypothetical protein